MGWRDGPLLGFDLETTGLGVHKDVPVQVGLVWTTPVGVNRADAFLVDPGCEIPEEAVAVHGITTSRARKEGCGLREATIRLHAAIRRAMAEEVPVVVMNASFDVTIAEELFSTFGLPALSWHALFDPLVMDRRVVPQRTGKRHLEALCEYYGVHLSRAHDAAADAAAAVAVARQLAKYFPELNDTDPVDLTVRHRYWHKEWAVGEDNWLREQELPGLESEEFAWPCRLQRMPTAWDRQPASVAVA
jgi:DNA polymerase-3 subunit epsilon